MSSTGQPTTTAPWLLAKEQVSYAIEFSSGTGREQAVGYLREHQITLTWDQAAGILRVTIFNGGG